MFDVTLQCSDSRPVYFFCKLHLCIKGTLLKTFRGLGWYYEFKNPDPLYEFEVMYFYTSAYNIKIGQMHQLFPLGWSKVEGT